MGLRDMGTGRLVGIHNALDPEVRLPDDAARDAAMAALLDLAEARGLSEEDLEADCWRDDDED